MARQKPKYQPRTMETEENFAAEMIDVQGAINEIYQIGADLTRKMEELKPILVGIESQYRLMKRMAEVRRLMGARDAK